MGYENILLAGADGADLIANNAGWSKMSYDTANIVIADNAATGNVPMAACPSSGADAFCYYDSVSAAQYGWQYEFTWRADAAGLAEDWMGVNICAQVGARDYIIVKYDAGSGLWELVGVKAGQSNSAFYLQPAPDDSAGLALDELVMTGKEGRDFRVTVVWPTPGYVYLYVKDMETLQEYHGKFRDIAYDYPAGYFGPRLNGAQSGVYLNDFTLLDNQKKFSPTLYDDFNYYASPDILTVAAADTPTGHTWDLAWSGSSDAISATSGVLTGKNGGKAVLATALMGSGTYKVRAKVWCRSVTGEAGVLFGATDGDNLYWVQFAASEVRLFRRDAGVDTAIATAVAWSPAIATGYEVVCELTATEVVVTVDGAEVFRVADATHRGQRVGGQSSHSGYSSGFGLGEIEKVEPAQAPTLAVDLVDDDNIIDLGQQGVSVALSASPDPIQSLTIAGIEQSIQSQTPGANNARTVVFNVTGEIANGTRTLAVSDGTNLASRSVSVNNPYIYTAPTTATDGNSLFNGQTYSAGSKFWFELTGANASKVTYDAASVESGGLWGNDINDWMTPDAGFSGDVGVSLYVWDSDTSSVDQVVGVLSVGGTGFVVVLTGHFTELFVDQFNSMFSSL